MQRVAYQAPLGRLPHRYPNGLRASRLDMGIFFRWVCNYCKILELRKKLSSWGETVCGDWHIMHQSGGYCHMKELAQRSVCRRQRRYLFKNAKSHQESSVQTNQPSSRRKPKRSVWALKGSIWEMIFLWSGNSRCWIEESKCGFLLFLICRVRWFWFY